MKLMYSPGACSVGIHVLLEEIGKPYETQLVNLREGGQFKQEYTTVNPKSKVPALVRDDGSVLTEYPAIAFWLARTNPDKKLLPDDVDAQARMIEAMDYAIATIHMQGFSRLFRASSYTPNPEDEDKVKERGKEMVEKGFAVMDKALAGKDYTEFWGAKRMNMKLPPNCEAHLNRMLARPAVQRVLQQEGLN
jgi:glutathione S-transferase